MGPRRPFSDGKGEMKGAGKGSENRDREKGAGKKGDRDRPPRDRTYYQDR